VTKHDIISIIQDSREQTPLDFTGLDCTVTVGTVGVFDYALADDPSGWAVERKALGDFVNSITTTEGQRLEQAKIRKARKLWPEPLPVVYVVESRWFDLLPQRPCTCAHERAAANCGKCKGKGAPFCGCVKVRPMLGCEFCHGSGVLGYNYDRRRITPQFTYHMLTQMMYAWKAAVLFADSRMGAACMIEGLLRRRHEHLKMKGLK